MLKNIPIIGKPNGLGINPIPVIGRFRNQVAQLFANLFTNQTTTIDGTRYLVNEGVKPVPENIISNGDFETGDFTGWDTSESAGNWSVVNNQAVMSSTSVFTPIKYNTGFVDGESYVIEVDVIVLEGILKVQGGLTSNFNVEFPETGSYKFVITESYSGDINDGWIQFARNTGSTCSATIDNVKAYPLSEDDEVQDALVITHEPFVNEFSARGDTLAEVNAQASQFDWQFTDNAGTLEVGYVGTETFLLSGDGTPLVTADNTHITLGAS